MVRQCYWCASLGVQWILAADNTWATGAGRPVGSAEERSGKAKSREEFEKGM